MQPIHIWIRRICKKECHLFKQMFCRSQQSPPLKFYLTQHTTPIAKSRVPLTPIWYWQVIQLNQENTIPSTPRHHRNTDKTPQKRRQSISKTPKTSPNTVKTLRTHHQSATKKPIETQLRDHQDTSRTDTTNSRKDLHRVFPKKLLPAYFVIIMFSYHHLLTSPYHTTGTKTPGLCPPGRTWGPYTFRVHNPKLSLLGKKI